MPWLAIGIVLLVISWVFRLSLVAYAAYCLLALVALGRWLADYWLRSVEATRSCSLTTAEVGDTVTISLRIRNKGRLPVAWLLLDDLLSKNAILPPPGRLQVVGRRVHFLYLGRGAVRSIFYQLRCRGRGLFQVGPLIAETGDLFGLYRRFRMVAPPHFLLVYPEIVPLEGYDIASRRPIGEIQLSHRLYEDPTRIAGVRDYQLGDPLNRIHWKATAKAGRLQSKQLEPSTIAGATIVVDLHKSSYPDHMRAELAITAAASIAYTLFQLGEQLGLVTNGQDAAERIRSEGWEINWRSRQGVRMAAQMHESSHSRGPLVIPADKRPDQFLQIRDILARVELGEGLTLGELLRETMPQINCNAAVIIIAPSLDDAALAAIADMVEQGMFVTVMVNTYDIGHYEEIAVKLAAIPVESRHLRDRDSIVHICSRRAIVRYI